ncbi:MAG: DUF2523 domain-containing protein [Ralstonia sp.]|jgi:hypothetical protein|uniref:DUF2523 domain-containing protein n=2 Tax=Ralstonia TaxID=48736 RepID=A0AAD2F1K5_9RALS|nr:DUF2523 family protein [Ralstonia sp. LMG 18095]MCL6467294.1 DUF2523 domain-containing protein [Ralstonia sp.]CAJ0802869.1 hypothetical protein R77560_03808 [Ralstonia sp. LMG 18095]CPR46748.1 Protein of uncharacterised function (DUF2523) [Chlamydia trachomatis]CPR56081.1 Protein of uncharacterised function (DUF2523) [Chlamydia trachomatis]
MDWLTEKIAGVILWVTDGVVRRGLASLGMGGITFMGVDQLFSSIKQYIIGGLTQLSQYTGFMSALGLGVAVNMILSAYAIRLVMNGLGSDGSITKFFLAAKS